MKFSKKLIPVIAIVVIAIVTLCAMLIFGRAEKLNKVAEESAVTAPEVESLYAGLDVIYPDEPDYETYVWNYALELGNWTFDDVTMTEDGDVVKDIMSYSAMMSNPRLLYIPSEEIVQAGMHKAISGPNIIINGYKVPEGDFYAREYYGEPAFVSYQISVAALKEAGLEQVEKGSNVPGAEEFLGRTTEYPYYIEMNELELDVTFTLLGYDEETNTYSFNAVNNGPFGGTSDIFHGFLDGDRVKTFPNAETEDGYLIDGAPEFHYVSHNDFNTYWRTFGYNRNVLRELVNKEYGTSYAPLDYEYDVEVKGDEYWSVVDPIVYTQRQNIRAKREEFYASHPEALEAWREEHPNWEVIDYEWDDPPVYPPKIRNAEEAE